MKEDHKSCYEAFEIFFDRTLDMAKTHGMDTTRMEKLKPEIISDFVYIAETWRATYTKRMEAFMKKPRDEKLTDEEYACYHHFVETFLNAMFQKLYQHNGEVLTARMMETQGLRNPGIIGVQGNG